LTNYVSTQAKISFPDSTLSNFNISEQPSTSILPVNSNNRSQLQRQQQRERER